MEDEDDAAFEARWAEREPVEGWDSNVKVTLEEFREWRKPRRGVANPERVSSPVWEWQVRGQVNAYLAADYFQEPDACECGPGWCFTRFGRTSTTLPDGRVIKISGEHEDSYDPDFFIYNDVTIVHPDGRIEFLLYPLEDFPPTDFHTATLLDDRIVLIGNLGYPQDRKPGTTQVLQLDPATMKIVAIGTRGQGPGWISNHSAELSEDRQSITIRGGRVAKKGVGMLVENFDDWSLSLLDWTWARLTDRGWKLWRIVREDRRMLRLYELRNILWKRSMPSHDPDAHLDTGADEEGFVPDLGLLDALYRPSIPHELVVLPKDNHRVRRIVVAGTVIRFTEDSLAIDIVVEGELPEETVIAILEEIAGKLRRLENSKWVIERC